MPGQEARGRKEPRTASPFAAARFKNREVFTPKGESGKVTSVLVGDDGQHYAIVDFGSELGVHQVPISTVSYQQNRFVIDASDVRALPAFVDGQKGLRSAEAGARIDILGYRGAADAEDSTILFQSPAPQVTVQRPALSINWEQAPPKVTVHQPTPQVNVRQLQPVIIVRQPPPKITVELEQPEIIVRMPDPEIDVAIAEPEVQVSMPRPQVQIVEPEQAQVRITAAEPLVSLLPRNPADVTVERGQPRVHYERMGEPQLTVRQIDGAPRIRFEEMPREEALRYAENGSDRRAASAQASILTPAARLLGLKAQTLYGGELGEVQRVLVGPDNSLHLALARGGFLGLASHRVLLPISRFAMRGDRLFALDMTDSDIDGLEHWDERMELYTDAVSDRPVQLSLLP